MNRKWDERFLDMAKLVASWSKDPSTKVGAVIVDSSRRVVSVGFNGFPQGVFDDAERYENRELKYKMVVHAEKNAISFAERRPLRCTIYTWPMMPCSQCAGHIIQAGIAEVVAPASYNPRWQEDFRLTEMMFAEAGVALRLTEPVDGYEAPKSGKDWISPVATSPSRRATEDKPCGCGKPPGMWHTETPKCR